MSSDEIKNLYHLRYDEFIDIIVSDITNHADDLDLINDLLKSNSKIKDDVLKNLRDRKIDNLLDRKNEG